MNKTNFDIAIDIVLGTEGGLVNHPKDPGGLTKYGISARAFPNIDIANLTLDSAKNLYLNSYWLPIKGDYLPGPVALITLDGAINQGVNAVSCILQESLGVAVDGIIGPQTLRVCQIHPRHDELIVEVAARRALRYAHGDIETFGLGWYRRLMFIVRRSLEGII